MGDYEEPIKPTSAEPTYQIPGVPYVDPYTEDPIYQELDQLAVGGASVIGNPDEHSYNVVQEKMIR